MGEGVGKGLIKGEGRCFVAQSFSPDKVAALHSWMEGGADEKCRNVLFFLFHLWYKKAICNSLRARLRQCPREAWTG